MALYVPEVYVPEPVWVVDNQRPILDPYYSRRRLVPDVHLKVPIFTLEDIARIKGALAVQGVYNVICDPPAQTVVVSTRLSPHTIVSLVRQAIGDATLITVVEPAAIVPAGALVDGVPRYSSYDDSYSPYRYGSVYSGRSYDPYNGRSYDNEFRPSSYYTGYTYY